MGASKCQASLRANILPLRFRLRNNLDDLRHPGFLAKVISVGTGVSVQQSAVTVQLELIPLPE
jgi:hypothetical protein